MKKISTGALALAALAITTGGALIAAVPVQDRPAVALSGPKEIEPPLADTRLTVHTLLREDIFAGFLGDDLKRFGRGEKNIDLLLEQRPGQKANLLSWKGGATLYRAVLALEAKRPEDFKRLYAQAQQYFADAGKLKTGNEAVNAITGGSFVVFADRLPKENRDEAWAQAYTSYQALWMQQSGIINGLPPHLRGEVLAGLAQSAQRTGHAEEAAQFTDKLLASLPDSAYAATAKKWKEDPKTAATSSVTCLSCHEAGRLADRLKVLDKK